MTIPPTEKKRREYFELIKIVARFDEDAAAWMINNAVVKTRGFRFSGDLNLAFNWSASSYLPSAFDDRYDRHDFWENLNRKVEEYRHGSR